MSPWVAFGIGIAIGAVSVVVVAIAGAFYLACREDADEADIWPGA